MRTTALRSAGRRSVRVAGSTTASIVLAVVAGGVPVAGAPVAGSCTISPAAGAAPHGPDLLGTFRLRDGAPEVLHLAHCTDGRWGWIWIGADVIPS